MRRVCRLPCATRTLLQEQHPLSPALALLALVCSGQNACPGPNRVRYTWANVTSLCEIDSPAPMGASFCTEGNGTAGSKGGPSGDAYSCGPWTDLSVAAADHKAHIAFFTDAFPEFVTHKNPVTIVGESCKLLTRLPPSRDLPCCPALGHCPDAQALA